MLRDVIRFALNNILEEMNDKMVQIHDISFKVTKKINPIFYNLMKSCFVNRIE